MLDAEADRLVNAERYVRDEERKGYRAGHYGRTFTTTAGEVNLKMPKLKGVAFETAIIERYRRRETSVEEALIEMYLAGVSVRRVEDITEALWGTKVSPGTISNLNKKAYPDIDQVLMSHIQILNLMDVPGFIMVQVLGGDRDHAPFPDITAAGPGELDRPFCVVLHGYTDEYFLHHVFFRFLLHIKNPRAMYCPRGDLFSHYSVFLSFTFSLQQL